MKQCKTCGEQTDNFYPRATSCKPCIIKRTTIHNQTVYRERRNQLQRERYRNDPTGARRRNRRQMAAWRRLHRNDPAYLTKKSRYDKESYYRHREDRLRKMKAYRLQNKDRIICQKRKHRRINLNAYITNCLRLRFYMALRDKDNGGKSNTRIVKKLLGCSIEAFKKHLEQQFQPGMTWSNKGKWEIDHIIPCSSFDLTKLKDQKQCFHYTNMQPLWRKDNRAKGTKLPRELTIKLSENG